MASVVNEKIFGDKSIVGRLIAARKLREEAVDDMFHRMANHCQHHIKVDEEDNKSWSMDRCKYPGGKNSGICAIEICPLLQ